MSVMQELQRIDKSTKPNHNTIAADILREHRLIYVTGEFFEYRGGCYRQVNELIVARYIMSRLGDMYSVKSKGEVLNSLKTVAHVNVDELNREPILNLKNGIFDMATWILSPHTPEIFSTIQLSVNFDKEASCPKWLKTVDEIMESDPNKIAILQQFFGLCLTKETKYCKALFMLGEGRNGKSTVLYVLENLVGDTNRSSIPLEMLNNMHYVAGLFGKLVNISVETSAKSEVYDSIFKQVVSGDSLTADRKYGQEFSFRPYCKLIYALNNMPRVNDKTDAYFRRLLILKFNRQFGEAEANKNLKHELMEEIDGIFLWCLHGLRDLERTGYFRTNAELDAEIESHKKDNNNVIAFVDERCEVGNTLSITKALLYDEYKKWCEESGHKPLTMNRFGKELVRQYGLEKDLRKSDNKTRERYWSGIDVLSSKNTRPDDFFEHKDVNSSVKVDGQSDQSDRLL